jgi:hypothetical protein
MAESAFKRSEVGGWIFLCNIAGGGQLLILVDDASRRKPSSLVPLHTLCMYSFALNLSQF